MRKDRHHEGDESGTFRRPAIRDLIGILLLALLTAGIASAQEAFDLARPALRLYGMESGLPSGVVYCFTKDARGRLWAGTVDGAAHFNGHVWIPLRLPEGGGSQYVRAILSSRDGSLWFGTQDGGAWRLHRGRWTNLRAGKDLPSNHVFSLAETQDSQGRLTLWVGTSDRGIVALSGQTRRAWSEAEGLPAGVVWRIREIRAPDGSVAVWAATERGLYRLEAESWRRLEARNGFPEQAANDVIDVEESDGRRTVWASLWTAGVARWDGRTWTLFGAGREFPGNASTSSLCATRDSSGRTTIWVGTLNDGLCWFEDGRWHVLGESRGFPFAGILGTIPVADGKPTLWIGTRGGGVASLDMGGWRTLDHSSGLPSAEVTAMAEEENATGGGTLWVGTSNGLVSFRRGRPPERVSSARLPSDYIYALHLRGEELWVATLKGVARKDASGWHREDGNGVLPEGMAISFLETTSRGGQRRFWVGTPKGLACLEQGRWRLLTRTEGFPNDYVSSLCSVPGADGEPVLWAGTRGGGVSRLERGAWTSFGEAAGLPNGTVYALHVSREADGRRWLWAGTLGGGLARLDLQSPSRWEVFSRENLPGLTSNYIQRIEEDHSGRIYLSTSNGVTRLTVDARGGGIRREKVEALTIGDGLPNPNGSIGASLVDSRGRVWIGTFGGAAVLDPDRETFPRPPPVPVLESAHLASPERVLDPGASLGHRDNHVHFEFSLPVFHRSEDTRYQTQLVGLESEPRPWQPEGWREFPTLPAGRYVFRLWARTFDGKISGPLEFPFSVDPAPWLRPLAFVLYGLAAAGAVLGLLRVRTRVLLERNEALSRAVKDRTRVIEEQSLALEASNRDLQQANRELTQLSDTDLLTQVSNRRKLDAVLKDELARARRYQLALSVVMLDLDHFKRVNDTHGHLVGDGVLVRVAGLLRESIRQVDKVGRWGGEEFLLVLPGTDPDQAFQVAEKLRQTIAAESFPVVLHGTASFGVATVREGDSVESLVARADAALYRAKEGGRDQVQAGESGG